MKKTIRNILYAAVAGMALLGCQKEVIDTVEDTLAQSITEQSYSQPLTTENGTLVFENEGHLYATLDQLSRMSPEGRRAFEDAYGFRSLGTIFHLVSEAEDAHQDRFFKGLDPDLSTEACERLGYFYRPTELYAAYLAKGVIREVTYADRSTAFELAIQNAAFENVLNERGEVIVGDRKLVFDGASHAEFSRETGELLVSDAAQKTALNGEYDFTLNARRPGGENYSSGVYWITDPAQGSNYRYFARAVFRSGFTMSSISQTFYIESRAERRRNGRWATRSNYNPIWGVNASWRYDYWIIQNGAGFGTVRDGAQYPLPNGTPRPTSPYYTSNLNSNHIVTYLYPHGFFVRSYNAGWDFFENVRLYNHSFTFNFSGGSSGYGYTAY